MEAFGRKGAQDDDIEVTKVYEKAEQIDAIIKDIKADSRAGRVNRKLFDKLQAALAATDKALDKVLTVAERKILANLKMDAKVK